MSGENVYNGFFPLIEFLDPDGQAEVEVFTSRQKEVETMKVAVDQSAEEFATRRKALDLKRRRVNVKKDSIKRVLDKARKRRGAILKSRDDPESLPASASPASASSASVSSSSSSGGDSQ